MPGSLRRASPLTGTLDGDADIHGTAARPEGRYALSVAKVVTPETRKAGLPPIDAKASGTLGDGRAGIEGRVSAGRGAELTLAGFLPVSAGGPIALKLRGTLDAAMANSLLSVGGQRVAGRIALDGGVSGTLDAPRAEGAATLSGGSFTDPLQGIALKQIEGRVTGRGDTLVVERLTAQTRNGGGLQASGRVALDPNGGFPGAFKITAERAELVSSPIVTRHCEPQPRPERSFGADAESVRDGSTLVSVDVTVPDRLPATVQPLPGVRRVNTPADVRVRLDAKADRKAKVAALGKRRKAPPPFDATLDVAVHAPNRIFVRGRGIDAELGGDLRLTGTSRDPVAVGDFAMRRGRLSIIGQRLDFTRGRLAFNGELAIPDLDFQAETKAAEVTARVAVTGPANQPDFVLTSDPSLPQDEVLSRLLFKKAAGGTLALPGAPARPGRVAALRRGRRPGRVRTGPQGARPRQPGRFHRSQRRSGPGCLALSQRPSQRRREGGRQAPGYRCHRGLRRDPSHQDPGRGRQRRSHRRGGGRRMGILMGSERMTGTGAASKTLSAGRTLRATVT